MGRWGQRILLACAAAGMVAGGTLSAGWKDYQQAEAIVGNTRLPDPGTMFLPRRILVDPVSRKVFLVDTGNHRVLRYPSKAALEDGTQAEAVFGQPDLYTARPRTAQDSLWTPEGAAMDSAGRLWVVDSGNYRVMRWDNAATAASGSMAAQVLGQPDFASRDNGGDGRMMQPRAVAVDQAGRLWVSDHMGERILRFDGAATKPNGGQPDGVLGQPDMDTYASGLTQKQFTGVVDLAVDAQGRLWASDANHGRILRFDNPASGNFLPADGVLGQLDFESYSDASGPSTIRYTGGITVANDGTLHVVDTWARRVLRWKDAASRTNGSPADGVLGRLGLAGDAPVGTDLGYLATPAGVAADPDGGLWVLDLQEERALRWNSILSRTNGAPADRILGFSPEVPWYRRNPLTGPVTPTGVLEDPITGKFFVGDVVRVLRYSSRMAAENGAAPEAALGRTKLSETIVGTVSDVTLSEVGGMALDAEGRLWVSDTGRNRVVAFDSAATAPTGAKMSRVLGHPSFTRATSGITDKEFRAPRGLVLDEQGGLWVADTGNHRILRFDSVATKTNGAAADAVLGQPDMTTAGTGTEFWRLKGPRGVALDSSGRLWVVDTERNRVVRYDTPRTATPTENPSGELGALANTSPRGMYQPYALAVTRHGRLWVADSGGTRVMRFENAASKTNRAAADGVLGAVGLSVGTDGGRSLEHFRRPEGLSLDANENLWLADRGNFRLMRFSPEESAVVESVSLVGGKVRLQFKTKADGKFIVQSSVDLRNWVDEETYQLPAGAVQLYERASDGVARSFRVLEP